MDGTSFTLFKACFPVETGDDPLVITQAANPNGSVVALVDSGTYGQLKVTLFPTDTLLLKAEFGQDIDIQWDVPAGDAPKRKRLHKALNVENSIC